MTITRLAGFAEVPTDVYVTGEGSEGGADLSKAIKFKAVCQRRIRNLPSLLPEKYHFADGTNAAAKTYFADGEVLKENGAQWPKQVCTVSIWTSLPVRLFIPKSADGNLLRSYKLIPV